MNLLKLLSSVGNFFGFSPKPGEAIADSVKRLKITGGTLTAGGATSLAYSLTNPEYISEITLLVQAITTLVGVIISAVAKFKSGEYPPNPPSALLLILSTLMSSVMIQSTTAAIIAQLQSNIPAVLIEEMPEQPDTYVLAPGKAALIVMYDGATPLNQPQAQLGSVQSAEMRYTVFSVSRVNKTLHSAALSCSGLMEAARLALQGFAPDPASPHEYLLWAGDTFSHQKNGVWYYQSNFTLKKLFV